MAGPGAPQRDSVHLLPQVQLGGKEGDATHQRFRLQAFEHYIYIILLEEVQGRLKQIYKVVLRERYTRMHGGGRPS